MKSITKYILEYKGHAIRDKEKSIGDPDEIKHYFGMGYVHLKFNKDNAYPYVYNKNLNKIIIGKANTIHNNIFNPDNEKELKEMGLEDVKAIGQIRYCCGVDDDTEEIDKWYEENKKYVDSTVCGRIWYDAQDDFESWDSEEQAEQMAKIFGELKEFDSCKCYVANWNEIEPSEFQKVNDAIVELFAKEHNKKIKSYIVIDNNGEPKEMFVGENAKVEKRSASHKKEMEELMDIHNPKHGESWEEFRKRKREATKGYNKARGEHFQRDYYNQTKSKTAAEWHNNKTKRYNPRTGKMEWGEKIGDNLQMKSLLNFINESFKTENKCYCSANVSVKNVKALVFQSLVVETIIKNTLIDNGWKSVVKTNESKSGVKRNINGADIIGTFKGTKYNIDAKTYNVKSNSIPVSKTEVISTIIDDSVYLVKSSDIQGNSISKETFIKNAFESYKLSNENLSQYKDIFGKYIKCENVSWDSNDDIEELDNAIIAAINFMEINGVLEAI